MKPYFEMTEAEQLDFGREVSTDPTLNGFERNGQPLTNCEMHAATKWREDQRRKAKKVLEEL